MSEWDAGPHREMAVDVPESFVGRTKTPPRYPPPKPAPTSVPAASSSSTGATNSAVTSTVVAVINSAANSSPGLRKKVTVAQAASAAAVGSNGVAGKPVPPPRDHLRIEEDGRLVNRAQPPQVTSRYGQLDKMPTLQGAVNGADISMWAAFAYDDDWRC